MTRVTTEKITNVIRNVVNVCFDCPCCFVRGGGRGALTADMLAKERRAITSVQALARFFKHCLLPLDQFQMLLCFQCRLRSTERGPRRCLTLLFPSPASRSSHNHEESGIYGRSSTKLFGSVASAT